MLRDKTKLFLRFVVFSFVLSFLAGIYLGSYSIWKPVLFQKGGGLHGIHRFPLPQPYDTLRVSIRLYLTFFFTLSIVIVTMSFLVLFLAQLTGLFRCCSQQEIDDPRIVNDIYKMALESDFNKESFIEKNEYPLATIPLTRKEIDMLVLKYGRTYEEIKNLGESFDEDKKNHMIEKHSNTICTLCNSSQGLTPADAAFWEEASKNPEFSEGTGFPDLICLPECKHTFHKNCLLTYLLRSIQCPTCRKNIRVSMLLNVYSTMVERVSFKAIDDQYASFCMDEGQEDSSNPTSRHNKYESYKRSNTDPIDRDRFYDYF